MKVEKSRNRNFEKIKNRLIKNPKLENLNFQKIEKLTSQTGKSKNPKIENSNGLRNPKTEKSKSRRID